MMRFSGVSLVAAVLCVCLAVASAQVGSPAGVVDHDALAAVAKFVAAQQHASGGFGSAANNHFAAGALAHVGGAVANKDAFCKDVAGTLQRGSTEELFHAVSAAKLAGCGSASLSAGAVKTLAATFAAGEELGETLFAYLALDGAGKVSAALEDELLEKVVEEVLDLMEEDGTFHASDAHDEEPSALLAGYAMRFLASVVSKVELDDAVAEMLLAVPETVGELFALAGDAEESSVLQFVDMDSPLRTTTLVLQGVSDLVVAMGEEDSVDVEGEQLVGFANLYLHNTVVSSVEDAFYLTEGVELLTSTPLGAPVVVQLQAPVRSLGATAKGEKGYQRVAVTDLKGNSVGGAHVFVQRAFANADPSRTISANQELFAVKDDASKTLYHFNFMAVKPAPGAYTLDFRVSPASQRFLTVDSVEQELRITTEVVVEDAVLAVRDVEESVVSQVRKFRLTQGETVGDAVSATQAKKIEVSFKLASAVNGKEVAPQQVFGRLVRGDVELFFVATNNGKDGHTLTIDLSKEAEDYFEYAGGVYKLELIVGGAILENSFVWHVANVEITFESEPEPEEELSTLYFPAAAPQHEIAHIFRTPDSRPSAGVSSLFSLIVLAPWAVLLAGLAAYRVNLRAFPTAGAGWLYALVFVGLLAAILLLLFTFWVRLTIFDTLYGLAALGVPAVLVGNRLLKSIAAERLGSKKAKQE